MNTPPVATVKKSHLTLLLWIIPAAALALCGWFMYRDFVSAGPLITITFKNGDGLEQENTPIRYRGTMVGEVKEVVLSKDTKTVQVTARLAGTAKELAREGSEFWIVRPELKVGSISGLRTIVSGQYIGVQPGTGEPTNRFVGSEEEPIEPQPKALLLTLTSPSLGSRQKQSPVFYRGIQVGEVLYFQLGSNSQQVMIHVRIWSQYAPLVREDSKFWNAGGFDFHLGLFKGVNITAESPRTVLSGGIEFATPNAIAAPAANESIFELHDKGEEKWKEWNPDIPLQLKPEAAHTNVTAAGSLLK